MRTWALVALVLAVARPASQTEGAADDSAARFDRMSEQEKAALRERLRQFKALPLDEQARIRANVARWRCASAGGEGAGAAEPRGLPAALAGRAAAAAGPVARVPEAHRRSSASRSAQQMREYLRRQSRAAPADDGEPPRVEVDDARAARADAPAAPRDAGEARPVTGLVAVLVLLSGDAGTAGPRTAGCAPRPALQERGGRGGHPRTSTSSSTSPTPRCWRWCWSSRPRRHGLTAEPLPVVRAPGSRPPASSTPGAMDGWRIRASAPVGRGIR